MSEEGRRKLVVAIENFLLTKTVEIMADPLAKARWRFTNTRKPIGEEVLDFIAEFMEENELCALCYFDIKNAPHGDGRWARSRQYFDNLWLCGSCSDAVAEATRE